MDTLEILTLKSKGSPGLVQRELCFGSAKHEFLNRCAKVSHIAPFIGPTIVVAQEPHPYPIVAVEVRSL